MSRYCPQQLKKAFHPDEVVDTPSRFVGRRKHLREAVRALANEQKSLVIIGEAGVGKSSMLRQIARVAAGGSSVLRQSAAHATKRADFYVISCVCDSSVQNYQELLGLVARELSKLLVKQGGKNTRRIGQDYLRDLRQAEKGQVESSFARIAETIIQVEGKEGLLLVIDDYDLVTRRAGFASFVERATEQIPNLRFCIAGTACDAHALFQENEGFSGSHCFSVIHLTALSPKEISSMLCRAGRRVGMGFGVEAIDELTLQTKGIPRSVHLLGEHALILAFYRGGTCVERVDVLEANAYITLYNIQARVVTDILDGIVTRFGRTHSQARGKYSLATIVTLIQEYFQAQVDPCDVELLEATTIVTMQFLQKEKLLDRFLKLVVGFRDSRVNIDSYFNLACLQDLTVGALFSQYISVTFILSAAVGPKEYIQDLKLCCEDRDVDDILEELSLHAANSIHVKQLAKWLVSHRQRRLLSELLGMEEQTLALPFAGTISVYGLIASERYQHIRKCAVRDQLNALEETTSVIFDFLEAEHLSEGFLDFARLSANNTVTTSGIVKSVDVDDDVNATFHFQHLAVLILLHLKNRQERDAYVDRLPPWARLKRAGGTVLLGILSSFLYDAFSKTLTRERLEQLKERLTDFIEGKYPVHFYSPEDERRLQAFTFHLSRQKLSHVVQVFRFTGSDIAIRMGAFVELKNTYTEREANDLAPLVAILVWREYQDSRKWDEGIIRFLKINIIKFIEQIDQYEQTRQVYAYSGAHPCGRLMRKSAWRLSIPSLEGEELMLTIGVLYCKSCKTVEVVTLTSNYDFPLAFDDSQRRDRRGFFAAVKTFFWPKTQ